MNFYIMLIGIIMLLNFIPQKHNKLLIFLIYISLVIIGGFRGENVGTDVAYYSYLYKHVTFNNFFYIERLGLLFKYLMVFFRNNICDEPRLFLALLHLGFLFGSFKLIKKHSKKPVFSIYLLISLGYYTKSFNIMRQMFGLGILLYFFSQFICNKNFKLYIFQVVAVSICIHSSLIIMISPLIFYMKSVNRFITKRNLIIYVIVSLIFSVTLKNYTLIFIPESLLRTFHYTYILDQAGFDFSYFNFFQALFCIYIIYLSSTVKDVFLFSYVFGVSIMLLLGSIHVVLNRVPLSLTILSIICFANILFDINSKRKFVYTALLFLYSLLIYSNILIKNYGEIIPYKNILLD